MKRLFFTVLFTTTILSVQAQLKFGIRVAPQLTWSSPDNKNTETNGTRINFGYGLMVDYYFSDNYAIGTEVIMQTYGTNLNLKKDKFASIAQGAATFPVTENLKYDYQLQYVQIPILLKMRTKEIGYTRYYAEFGVTSGILTRAKADVDMGAFKVENMNVNAPDDEDRFSIETVRYKDGVKTFRAALSFGAGIQHKMFGESYLVAGLRYDNALNSFTEDDRWKTGLSGLSLNVGILF